MPALAGLAVMTMIRRLLIAALLLLSPSLALADPEPDLLGDVARPGLKVDLRVPVAGELAPQTAREWLFAVGPSFRWWEVSKLRGAKTLTVSRDFIDLHLGDQGCAVGRVQLRVFREPRLMVALATAGSCCSGECVRRIHFFVVEKDALSDHTDRLWPRFPWRTRIGTSEDLSYELPTFGTDIKVMLRDRPAYTLKLNTRDGRYDVTWRHKEAVPAFPRKRAR
jgi:hypothetical protein